MAAWSPYSGHITLVLVRIGGGQSGRQTAVSYIKQLRPCVGVSVFGGPVGVGPPRGSTLSAEAVDSVRPVTIPYIWADDWEDVFLAGPFLHL